MENINTPEHWDEVYKGIWAGNARYRGVHEDNKFIASQIVQSGAKVLDVGCGDGELLHQISLQKDCELNGCDITPIGIEYAKKLVPNAHFEVIPTEPKELPFSNIDLLLCIQTIEHLENPAAYVEKWKKSLIPNGIMFFIIPYNCVSDDHIGLFDFKDLQYLINAVKPKEFIVTTRNVGLLEMMVWMRF